MCPRSVVRVSLRYCLSIGMARAADNRLPLRTFFVSDEQSLFIEGTPCGCSCVRSHCTPRCLPSRKMHIKVSRSQLFQSGPRNVNRLITYHSQQPTFVSRASRANRRTSDLAPTITSPRVRLPIHAASDLLVGTRLDVRGRLIAHHSRRSSGAFEFLVPPVRRGCPECLCSSGCAGSLCGSCQLGQPTTMFLLQLLPSRLAMAVSTAAPSSGSLDRNEVRRPGPLSP